MEKYIQEQYQYYKRFMGNVKLPNIKPILNTDSSITGGTLAHVNSDDIRKNLISIYFSRELFEYNEQYYKSKLYHEFTHIYDANIIFNEILDIEKFDKLMSSYSEFHASQVELLSCFNYDSIDNINPKFDINSMIYEKNELMDINDYLLHCFVTPCMILEKERTDYMQLNKHEYNVKYVLAQKTLMYYLGKYSVCDMYSKGHPYYLFDKLKQFEIDAKILYISLKRKMFDEVLTNVENFMNHFLLYFFIPR